MTSLSDKRVIARRKIEELYDRGAPRPESLPTYAGVGFTARALRRALPVFDGFSDQSSFEEITTAIENSALNGRPFADASVLSEAARLADQYKKATEHAGDNPTDIGWYGTRSSVADGVLAACEGAQLADNRNERLGQAVFCCYGYADWFSTMEGIWSDFETLLSCVEADKWTDATPIPKDVFALHSTFDLEAEFGDSDLLTIRTGLSEKLIEYFQANPARMYDDLSPRQFEELIAELFSGFGFSVNLTARTRDGGYDVSAIQHNEFGWQRYLIECKRYEPEKKISVDVVRSLHGVVVSENATKGIIATTASFSKPALNLADKHKYILEPRDLKGVTDWLTAYQIEMLKHPKKI